MFDLSRRALKTENLDSQSEGSTSNNDLGEIVPSDDDSCEEFYSANGSPSNTPKSVASPILDEPELEDAAAQVVALLDEYITHADESLRAVAAEGLARLIFSRRVALTPKLLTRLILVYFNPINEDCDPLRQSLSVFFPAFAFCGPQLGLSLEAAFVPALRVLLDAPSKSPLSYVSPPQVAQFMLQLITTSCNESALAHNAHLSGHETLLREKSGAGTGSQQRIAESLLNSILESEDDVDLEMCRLYAKVLTSLRLDAEAENAEFTYLLQKQVRSAIAFVEDRRTIALLRRFERHITTLPQ
jgi:Nuclear condensing complex subunits, C-term domain